MKELTKRTIFGLLYLAVFMGSLWLNDIAFAVVCVFIAAVGTAEALKLMISDISKWMLVGLTATIVICCMFIPLNNILTATSHSTASMIAITIAFGLPFVVPLFTTKHSFQQIASGIWVAYFFVLIPVTFMMCCISYISKGKELLTLIFAIVCLNDIFAYLVGKSIGKHKLFERISPAKTIEGCIGGIVLSVLSVFLFNKFAYSFTNDLSIIVFAFAVAAFGILGDLFESMLKRQAGVKDSGKVIPGHGGILDRLDSMFFALPLGVILSAIIF